MPRRVPALVTLVAIVFTVAFVGLWLAQKPHNAPAQDKASATPSPIRTSDATYPSATTSPAATPTWTPSVSWDFPLDVSFQTATAYAEFRKKIVDAGPPTPRPEDLRTWTPGPPTRTSQAGVITTLTSSDLPRDSSSAFILEAEFPVDPSMGLTRRFSSEASTVGWSSDGRYLAAGGGGGLMVWDFPELDLVDRLFIPEDRILALDWSPSGDTLAAGSDRGMRLLTWDITSGSRPHYLDNWGAVYQVAWSPDGRLLASSGQGSSVNVWDSKTRKQLLQLTHKGAGISGFDWAPDGTALASEWGGTVKVWQIPDGRLLREISPSVPRGIVGLGWAPDGLMLAAGGHVPDQPNCVVVWDVVSWAELAEMGSDCITGELAWHPFANRIALAGENPSLWSANPFELEHTLSMGARILAWSPDGEVLAGSWGDYIVFWDGGSGAPLSYPEPPTHPPGSRFPRFYILTAIAWSPDSQYLAATTTDGTLQLFRRYSLP